MTEMDRTEAGRFGAGTVTRFAPSPTGLLHLGNVRTALFSWLLARHAGGRFILRIEDTDAARSTQEYTAAILEDLRFLGLNWDVGPGQEDGRGPYLQSQRAAIHRDDIGALTALDRVYPCFCSPEELEVQRRAQLAAGRPPRYAGTCSRLTEAERAMRRASGVAPSLRLRIPRGQTLEFVDLVHGLQSFRTDDIGDFVVQRADGSAAFFFSNAVDDARMGVTHVLRGDDHLTNTPRQLLILAALGLPAPTYGHLPLILGDDGSPLSKRHGATSLAAYRAEGYLPEALTNHLFRLGHSSPETGLLSLSQQVQAFDPKHLGRASAHFDRQQLTMWQKTAVHQLPPQAARRWLAPALPPGLPEAETTAFLTAVLPNVVLPEDARLWAKIVFDEPPPPEEAGRALLAQAGPAFFSAAAAAAGESPQLPAIVAAVRTATGRKGAALYMPLRVALTGLAHGPELAPLLAALPRGKARERLARHAQI